MSAHDHLAAGLDTATVPETRSRYREALSAVDAMLADGMLPAAARADLSKARAAIEGELAAAGRRAVAQLVGALRTCATASAPPASVSPTRTAPAPRPPMKRPPVPSPAPYRPPPLRTPPAPIAQTPTPTPATPPAPAPSLATSLYPTWRTDADGRRLPPMDPMDDDIAW